MPDHRDTYQEQPIIIDNHCLGPGYPPLIVAELSGNHNGSLKRALALVDAAAQAGANAVKLQTYTADTMTINHDGPGFVVTDPNSPWHGCKLFDLYQRAATPWDWHEAIFDRCRQLGLLGFSAAFDASAADFLDTLQVPCHKIASFEAIDIPLIKRLASTGKPLLISTGMASGEELDEAVTTAREAGCTDLILLRCTSAYPAPIAEANLRVLDALRSRYRCLVGLSDHTLGTTVAVAAVARGAVLIEKHLTLARSDYSVDATFSLEPSELAALVTETHAAWSALGSGILGEQGEQERLSVVYRRSLYVVADIAQDEVFTAKNIRAIRPGFGLEPKHYQTLLGRRAKQALTRGTPLSWESVAD
jgi:N-acetylneuraminate synthase